MKLRKSPVVRKAVQTAIETLEQRQLLSATLALVNPAVYPSNDRLIFNYIQHPDANVPNVIHDRQTLQITNTGTDPLVISSLVINGPWQFINAPAGGYTNVTVNPGTPLNVTLQFTQRSLPAKSYNETNFTNNTNGGAAITGSLTINSNDATTPSKVVTLAGYWQNVSNNNAEPSMQTIVNLLAGDTTLINSTPIPDLAQNSGAQLYGSEVYSAAWQQADPSQNVMVQQIAGFHTQGNSAHLYWYNAASQASHSLFTDPGNEGQTVLPTLSNGNLAVGNFNPNGAFGLRVDNEYSNDAINTAAGNTGGGGHHFRFFPLRDSSGNTIPNTYIVGMDYGVLQAENFDFQDNLYLVTNIRPTTTPGSPTGLTATGGATPTLSWNAVSYSPVGYNVYRSTSLNGAYTLLTTTPITTGTTYTDTSAPGGALYYQVTAVDSTQVPVAESVPATVVVNGGPVAANYTFNSYSSQVVTFNPLVNDTDATGTLVPGSVTIGIAPTHGGTTTVNSANGLITYTANAGFTGTETFTYTVADSNGAVSAPGTVTFKVTAPVVSSPIANNVVATTLEGTAVQIPVLDSANAATSFNLATVTITTQPKHGTPVVNSDGSITYTPSGTFIGGDELRYTVQDNNGQVSNVAIVDINVGVEISSAKGANHVLAYTDQNGTDVTVTLNRGVADVFFDGSANAPAAAKNGKVTVTGGSSLHIREIALSGTTTASTLSIIGKKNGAVNLGGIVDTDPMGVINARTSNLTATASSSSSSLLTGPLAGGTALTVPAGLTASPQAQIATPVVTAGTINVTGVRSIFLRSASGATIDVGDNGVSATTISIAGAVTNSSLASTVPLTMLKAASWTDTGNQATVIIAPSITNLNISGNFDPDLTLSGSAKPISLTAARIAGQVSSGVWNIAGDTRTVTFGSANANWGGASFIGGISSLVVRSGGLASDITAASIGTVRVAGILSGDVTSGGNITSVVAGALSGSSITAGVQAGTLLASASAVNLGSSTIKTVQLTSHAVSAFSNSRIMADIINTANLGAVNTSNGGTPEGIAAVTVKAVSAKIGGVALHLGKKQLVDDPTLAAYIASKNVSFGDFVINLATPVA